MRGGTPAAAPAEASEADATEREVVRLLARHPGLWAERGAAVRALSFSDPVAREVIENFALPLSDVLHKLTPAAQGLVTAAGEAAADEDGHAVRLLRDCLAELRRREAEAKSRECERRLAECERQGDAAGVAEQLEAIAFWSDVMLTPEAAQAEVAELRRRAEQENDTGGQARTRARLSRLEKIIKQAEDMA